jgi:hypothetical protein
MRNAQYVWLSILELLYDWRHFRRQRFPHWRRVALFPIAAREVCAAVLDAHLVKVQDWHAMSRHYLQKNGTLS